ncbi:hypothetical protein [Gimesia sp.]|uniref:hypothetical protein n=1 Tax=Gimesia sp. TaxID=2024833 RepID=UPI000C45A6BF|nr:hypothetical protein [Gimesia sp.]MAX37195.1 hypothetical protein [Gimesia sp.]HBL41789.1 hypothetical protein [Planctomycetaceae bacterium]|tara:strand:- start:7301 stop:7846 length:546 start_codon:yes stop_codon:yes gene_type:complete
MSSEISCVTSILCHLEQNETALCCHIGRADVFTIAEQLVQKLRDSGQTAVFANSFTPRPVWWNRFIPQSSVGWFSGAAGCSRKTAADIMAQLPVPVHKRLTYNAGNPRCFLAVAALAYSKPDYLIYTTSGMDPLGRNSLQSSIHEICGGSRAVHIINDTGNGNCPTQSPMKCVFCSGDCSE